MFLLRTVASLAVCGATLWCANSVASVVSYWRSPSADLTPGTQSTMSETAISSLPVPYVDLLGC
jgi:hypothetical protein